MRAWHLILVALLTNAALATEPKEADVAVKAAEPKTADAAVEDTKPKKAAVAAKAAKKVALHEHPTIVKMLNKNNELRQQYGLKRHKISPELTRAAQDHALYMARTGNFSHHSNLGPMGRAAKYRFRGLVMENIAMGQRTVASAFGSWRSSGPHWSSITSSAPLAGFGYALSRNGTPYWVGVYGYPQVTSSAAASD